MRDPRFALYKSLHWMTKSGASAYHYFDAFACELMVAAIPPEYWHELTVSLYGENRLLYSHHHQMRLAVWEERIIDSLFPKPPGRILVGATGSGREMRHLALRGYQMVGFDPSEPALARAKASVDAWDAGSLLSLENGTYADIAAQRLAGVERGAPYDAVLLGWGSMAHVHSADERRALFERLRQLCPRGPVLFSSIREPATGQGRRQLRTLLRRVGLARPNDQSWFRALVGFYSTISPAEVRTLAAETGYRVVEQGEEGPHAVFLPASA